jgi:hypothetical protein
MKKTSIILFLMLLSIFATSLIAQVDINFGGEIKFRNRINFDVEGSNPGFEFYELEFFIDGDITDYNSFYIEYTAMHKTKPEPENVWIDLHAPMRPAFAQGGMGIRIGHYHVPFGYENDDNEGYMYHGRSSVNHSLIHGETVDGWKLRNRQIGITGCYSVGPVTAWLGVFNGNGNWTQYGASDSKMWDYDYSLKIQAEVANIEIGASHWIAPGVDTRTVDDDGEPSDYNGHGGALNHTRDITRTGVHFKWPASSLYVAQDPALGGSPFLVFGEYIIGEHKDVYDWDEFDDVDQNLFGYFIETQVSIIPETLVGFLRYDYYEPNEDVDDDETTAITPGINWFFWNSMKFILEYDYIDNKADNTLAKQDRIALEISLTF